MPALTRTRRGSCSEHEEGNDNEMEEADGTAHDSSDDFM